MRCARACAVAVLTALLLAACGTPPREPPVPREEPRALPPAEKAPQPGKVVPLSDRTRRYLASRGLTEIETRPLDVSVECTFRDERGYGGRLDLDVRAADVRRFAATVDVPGRGQCRFALRDFRQTETLPNVRLASATDACTVRMWEQGNQVSVAFSACQAQCDSGTFDYLWPILVEKPSGRCF